MTADIPPGYRRLAEKIRKAISVGDEIIEIDEDGNVCHTIDEKIATALYEDEGLRGLVMGHEWICKVHNHVAQCRKTSKKALANFHGEQDDGHT